MTNQLLAQKIQKAKKPEDIFDSNSIETKYKELVKIFHPDIWKIEAETFKKLTSLKNEGLQKIQEGTWGTVSLIDPLYTDDAGSVYKDGLSLVFSGPEEFIRYSYVNWNSIVSSKDKVSQNIARYMCPKARMSEALVNGKKSPVLYMEREKPAFRISAQLIKTKFPNGFDEKHVAWIASRMYEYIALLHTQGLVHSGINPESVFIVPETHGIYVTSFYHMKQIDSKLDTISAKYKNWYPAKVLYDKKARETIDIELVGRTALYLLGDQTGTGYSLLKKKGSTQEFIKFFMSYSENSGEHYKNYRELLKKIWGPSKYYKLEL